MAIGSVIERGSSVYVYDEKGHQIAVLPGGTKTGDGLRGYTGSTVSIRRGTALYTYNEKGRQMSVAPAR